MLNRAIWLTIRDDARDRLHTARNTVLMSHLLRKKAVALRLLAQTLRERAAVRRAENPIAANA
jgi:hypothetical protein